MLHCTYTSGRGGTRRDFARSAPPLEVHAAVLPATRPCSGCRLFPVVRLRPYQRPRYSLGRTGGLRVVFRRDSKVDAFQRQISALRHQLGGENDDEPVPDLDRPLSFEQGYSVSTRSSPISFNGPRTFLCLSRAHRYLGVEKSRPRLLPPIPAIDFQTSVIAQSTSWRGDLESSRVSAHPWAGGGFADCTGHDFRRGGGGR